MEPFGRYFRYLSAGESHGPAIEGHIWGVPAGLRIDNDLLQTNLQRRKQALVVLPDGSQQVLPGGSSRASSEPDEVVWTAGVADGVTTGEPISYLVPNACARPRDYEELREVFRPGHADYTYFVKYGETPQSGGGRASARETVARVVAGTIAQQLIARQGIAVSARLVQVGQTSDSACFADEIAAAQAANDSVGGVVECRITGVPAGWGEPLFGKMQSQLAAAMFSIPACKGFEYGFGFASASMRGSESNTFSGGMLGGITDGTDIVFRCAFKPTPSISAPQMALTVSGEMREIRIQGRHDACVAARAVPVVEAMTAMVLADYLLAPKS